MNSSIGRGQTTVLLPHGMYADIKAAAAAAGQNLATIMTTATERFLTHAEAGDPLYPARQGPTEERTLVLDAHTIARARRRAQRDLCAHRTFCRPAFEHLLTKRTEVRQSYAPRSARRSAATVALFLLLPLSACGGEGGTSASAAHSPSGQPMRFVPPSSAPVVLVAPVATAVAPALLEHSTEGAARVEHVAVASPTPLTARERSQHLVSLAPAAPPAATASSALTDEVPRPARTDHVPPAKPVWHVHAGQSLKDILPAWCRDAGYNPPVFQTALDWIAETNADISGNFEEALQSLLTGFDTAAVRPIALVASNKTVIIQEQAQ
jgi:hypothetical protein